MPRARTKITQMTRRIDRWVKKKKLPKYVLADMVGCHPLTIYAISIGRHWGPTGDRLDKILKQAGV